MSPPQVGFQPGKCTAGILHLVEETLAFDQRRVLLEDQRYVEPDRMQVESTPMEKEAHRRPRGTMAHPMAHGYREQGNISDALTDNILDLCALIIDDK